MLTRMTQIVRERADFIEAALDPETPDAQLKARQQRLFALQEEVLAYKLSCRMNIIRTFSADQWDSLYCLLNDLQAAAGN